ncbi:hypothetical protein [Mycoplasma sp. 3686d]|uniref:hypothetical protein n=1 Tax=Mycoplasma sp. 3686d TaxID=2967300 RepID=UPI00211B873E|nr:hypothetical protein [Mycoplasma sp. 3686d]UUM24541.1 hypothetical protein NPA12_02465 [Mycoplasma sp. 3686d]
MVSQITRLFEEGKSLDTDKLTKPFVAFSKSISGAIIPIILTIAGLICVVIGIIYFMKAQIRLSKLDNPTNTKNTQASRRNSLILIGVGFGAMILGSTYTFVILALF